MFNYLRTNEASKDYNGVASKLWFHNRAITGDIKTKMRAFVSFAKANENAKLMDPPWNSGLQW